MPVKHWILVSRTTAPQRKKFWQWWHLLSIWNTIYMEVSLPFALSMFHWSDCRISSLLIACLPDGYQPLRYIITCLCTGNRYNIPMLMLCYERLPANALDKTALNDMCSVWRETPSEPQEGQILVLDQEEWLNAKTPEELKTWQRADKVINQVITLRHGCQRNH